MTAAVQVPCRRRAVHSHTVRWMQPGQPDERLLSEVAVRAACWEPRLWITLARAELTPRLAPHLTLDGKARPLVRDSIRQGWNPIAYLQQQSHTDPGAARALAEVQAQMTAWSSGD